jgi:hypothetical protein
MRVKLDRHAQKSKKIAFCSLLNMYILPRGERVVAVTLGSGEIKLWRLRSK